MLSINSTIEFLRTQAPAYFVGLSAFCLGPDGLSQQPSQAPAIQVLQIEPAMTGLSIQQCWLSMSLTPDDEVCIGVSDHRQNFALVLVNSDMQSVRYCADAASASRHANNWLSGETAEKVHVKPMLYHGQFYVATADFTGSDDGYLNHRGCHWYALEIGNGMFRDCSKSERNGVAAENASIVAAVLNEGTGHIYAHDASRGILYDYDLEARKTRSLGYPLGVQGKQMPGRYMWLGAKGSVYFTTSLADHVLSYDESKGWGEKKEWKLYGVPGNSKVIRTGTKSKNGKWVYLADEEGHFWRYSTQRDELELLGTVFSPEPRYQYRGFIKVRALNVSDDDSKLYFINDDAECSALWEWDFFTKRTTCLTDLAKIDKRFTPDLCVHAGNDTMDSQGRIYFCAFSPDMSNPHALLLCRVDPARIVEALQRR